jgi:hypothetical protein
MQAARRATARQVPGEVIGCGSANAGLASFENLLAQVAERMGEQP